MEDADFPTGTNHHLYDSCELYCPRCYSSSDSSQFLDEVDYLADHIAILAAPGKLLASGSPVSLKHKFGQGYALLATLKHPFVSTDDFTEQIRRKFRHVEVSNPVPGQICYRLPTGSGPADVEKVLQILAEKGERNDVLSYDILAPSIEDVFLELLSKNDKLEAAGDGRLVSTVDINLPGHGPGTPHPDLQLADGRAVSPLGQALTVFYKRSLIMKRHPLAPILGVATVVAGAAYVPLKLLKSPNRKSVPHVSVTCLLNVLKAAHPEWVLFFPAALAVFPAFFASYVSKEKQSAVRAMHFSNGLSNPLGLWLGHLMFDTMFTVVSVSLVILFLNHTQAFRYLEAFVSGFHVNLLVS
jgi:hypothetical protein